MLYTLSHNHYCYSRERRTSYIAKGWIRRLFGGSETGGSDRLDLWDSRVIIEAIGRGTFRVCWCVDADSLVVAYFEAVATEIGFVEYADAAFGL